MSAPLIEELRRIEHFPPSHLPSIGEVLEIVGKLTAYIEHGPDLFQAAKRDVTSREAKEPALAVDQLLSPPEPEPDTPPSAQGSAPTAAPATAAAGASAPDPRDAELAELRQQVATLMAAAQRTTADVPPPPSPGDVRG